MAEFTQDELKKLAECDGVHITLDALFECDSCNLLFDSIFTVDSKE